MIDNMHIIIKDIKNVHSFAVMEAHPRFVTGCSLFSKSSSYFPLWYYYYLTILGGFGMLSTHIGFNITCESLLSHHLRIDSLLNYKAPRFKKNHNYDNEFKNY